MLRHGAWRFAVAVGSVAALTVVLLLLQPYLAVGTLVLCYVPLVLVVAIQFGRRAAILCSFASFLAYNFFFVPPLYTLFVARQQDVIELFIFLSVSLLAGTLASRERALALAATRRAEQMTVLYQLSQDVSAAVDDSVILPQIAAAALQMLPACGIEIVLVPREGRSSSTTRAGRTDGDTFASVPVVAGGLTLGELHVWGLQHGSAEEIDTLLRTIANHVALVVERSRAVAAVWQARSLRDADLLKGALLSSVSHDLRTPLAVIKGAASNLLDTEVSWNPATQRIFAETISSEADRLNRFVRNLLEMSRLEGGTMQRPRSLIDISDVIGATLHRLHPVLTGHPVEVVIALDLPPVAIDAVQLDLVLSNLLENAAKFSSDAMPIEVNGRRHGDELLISVLDWGSGIPDAAFEHIFEKFYRWAGPEHGPGGSGLGLAICQGIVTAHGGHIWAENRPDGGAAFRFTLPIAAETLNPLALPLGQSDGKAV
ncbi:MAG: DUF4118 domain-containing protein [Herpetosiphonaceae bacterium]|nr:DUF4118 domain-containing protein [Herpetosiphonaceae bacterium]